MNWYKKSDISTLEDRNDLNSRIRLFKKIITQLTYLTKYIFQNARHGKETLKRLKDHKTISSFPDIKKMIDKAYEKALDSYNVSTGFCQEAADRLFIELKKLEKERNEFSNKKYPAKIRERIKNGKE